jgi:UDP-perosamine 4-acetyltransferase
MVKMDEVVIIGSGGHAKVVIEILKVGSMYTPIGCTDIMTLSRTVAGVPVIGDDSVLPSLYRDGIRHAFIAIGDNRLRAKLALPLQTMGFCLINAVSSHAYLSPTVKLEAGIAVMPGVVINPDAIVEENAIINTGATIDHDCVLRSFCHVAPGCNLAGNVTIGKGTLLGIGCSIIPGVKIGEWCVVGAGSVVTQDLPAFTLALGAPAKVRRRIQESA